MIAEAREVGGGNRAFSGLTRSLESTESWKILINFRNFKESHNGERMKEGKRDLDQARGNGGTDEHYQPQGWQLNNLVTKTALALTSFPL